MDKSKKEAERRFEVAEEKLAGSLIEYIERGRTSPIVFSIVSRIFTLDHAIREFSEGLKTATKNVPMTTKVPKSTVDQTNFLINTHNSIIEDIHKNLKKKDSYINEFKKFDELIEPTLMDIFKTLYMVGMNCAQITSYLIRWTE